MYIAMKYIQPMSQATLWPWEGNAVLDKIPPQVLSSLPFKKQNTAPFLSSKLSSVVQY